MATSLLKMSIKDEQDVVLARQRSRLITEHLGYDQFDQAHIATAVAELARNAFQYAGGGDVEFLIADDSVPKFHVLISDQGKGIENLPSILKGEHRSRSGLGLGGMAGARNLMDEFLVETGNKGTHIRLVKKLGPNAPAITPSVFAMVTQAIKSHTTHNLYEEVLQQNKELLVALNEMKQQRTDLTEINRGVVALYTELDERAQRLKHASELKTALLSNMTHEFRTPLNSMISISQMLIDRLDGELRDEQEKQIAFIQKGARGLTVLVNDLLDLAKVEAGKMHIQTSLFSVSDIFSTLRGMMRPLLGRDAAVVLVFEESENFPQLKTDETKVSQILRNFISNGLKFTQKGEVRVSVRQSGDGMITFAVSDTGIGIAPQDQTRVFEEFIQVEGKHQKKIRGTGLGLSLAKKMADLLKGTITLESTAGLGSTFFLTIPMNVENDEAVVFAEPAPSPDLVRPPQTVRTILLIDDNDVDRYVFKRNHARANLTILEGETGMRGIEIARQTRPDFIFLDLSLPDMTGFEILKNLKDNDLTKHIPVIIRSSMVLRESEQEFLAARARFIISKDPEHAEKFDALVNDLLNDNAAVPSLTAKEARNV